MKNYLFLILVLFLVSCGKSEIDKCVEAKIENYLSDKGTIILTCSNICKFPDNIGELPKSETEILLKCYLPCDRESSQRNDVRQYIRTKYESDIRLECLRAASGKN